MYIKTKQLFQYKDHLIITTTIIRVGCIISDLFELNNKNISV